MGSGSLEATALYDAGMHYRTFAQSNRATFDARLRQGTNREVGFELEAAWQIGTQQYLATSAAPVVNQDVGAWLAEREAHAADARTAAASRARSEWTSSPATRSAGDGTYRAFNTMYATNHPFYGLMDLFTDPAARTNDRGLVDAHGDLRDRAPAANDAEARAAPFRPAGRRSLPRSDGKATRSCRSVSRPLRSSSSAIRRFVQDPPPQRCDSARTVHCGTGRTCS